MSQYLRMFLYVTPRKPLKALTARARRALHSAAGAFDLPSIIAGVVVVGILTAGVLAAIFGVIPFAQDNGAKQDLSAARTAEGVAKTKDGVFKDVSGLVASGYLTDQPVPAAAGTAEGDTGFSRVASTGTVKLVIGVNGTGSCYLALAKSGTGKVFHASDVNAEPQQLTPEDKPGCVSDAELQRLVDALGGFEGSFAPPAPTVTGTAPGSHLASFSWNAAPRATGYRVESRINGADWTLLSANQPGTSAEVASSPGDVIDVRVITHSPSGDSGSGAAMVKLPDSLIANWGFEDGINLWTPAGTTVGSQTGKAVASSAARTGHGAATISGNNTSASLSQRVNIPADKFSTLEFWYTADNYGYTDKSATEVQIWSADGSTFLKTEFTTQADVTAWKKGTADLTAYKGQTVTLKLVQSNVNLSSSTSTWDDLALISTPPVITAAPTGVGGSAYDGSVSLTWTAPSSAAVPVTEYVITPYLNGAAQTPVKVNGSPAPVAGLVSGLTNGAAYTFTVKATNSAGTSPESAPSAAITVGAPPILNAGFEAGLDNWTVTTTTVGSQTGKAVVSTTARTGNGAATLSGVSTSASIAQQVKIPADMFSTLEFWYTSQTENRSLTRTEVGIWSADGKTLLKTEYSDASTVASWKKGVVDLTAYKGQTVTLMLSQYNANLSSSRSTWDDLALISTPPVITAAPTRVGATADNGAVSLAWAAPSSAAVPINEYIITPYLNGVAQTPTKVTGNPAAAQGTVTGLTNGANYTFTVKATNSAGTSVESDPTGPLTVGPVAIRNAGFEAGLKDWTATVTTSGTNTGKAIPSTTTHSGYGAATLSGYSTSATLSQQVTIPTDKPWLEFWYSCDNDGSSYSRSEVQVLTADGKTQVVFTKAGDSKTLSRASADLSAYKGQTVTLKLVETNANLMGGTSTWDDLAFVAGP